MVTRRFPKSLKDAIAEIKSQRDVAALLLLQKDEMQDKRDKAEAQHRVEYNARLVIQRERDETAKQFADLKERLLTSETECARLRGYLERVREDDAVADPLVEIEGPDGKRLVSKRHPSPQHFITSNVDHYEMARAMRGEKPKHWTSY